MTVQTRKHADERKKEIVSAALLLAGKIGPDSITTQALAEEVGISQPGVFRHFPTKSAIWEEVARHIGKLLPLAPAEKNGHPVAAREQICRAFMAHLKFIKMTPAIPFILFSRELHAKNDHLRRFFAALIKKRHQYFANLIQEEITAHRFRQELDPNDGAYLIVALLQGLAMRWSLNAREFDLIDEGRRLLALQLEGFTAPDRATRNGERHT